MITQEALIILLFKIVIVSGFLSLIAWIAVYTKLAKWWRNPVGRTLVAKTALIAALLVPSALSLFLNLNRLDSFITAWVDIALIGLITPVMVWRTTVWIRLHRAGKFHQDNGGADGTAAE